MLLNTSQKDFKPTQRETFKYIVLELRTFVLETGVSTKTKKIKKGFWQ